MSPLWRRWRQIFYSFRFTPKKNRPFSAHLFRPFHPLFLFLWSEDLFVRRRLRSDFSRFDPASPGDGPTLATLLAAWIEDLYLRRRPSVRVGGRAALISTPGAKATDFSRFGAHLCLAHFSRFTPKYPTLATSSPGWHQCLLAAPAKPCADLELSSLLCPACCNPCLAWRHPCWASLCPPRPRLNPRPRPRPRRPARPPRWLRLGLPL